jgi:hypothetical protein
VLPDEVRDRIRAMRAAGMTLQAVADELNAEGVSGPQGGRWRPSYVRWAAMSDSERAADARTVGPAGAGGPLPPGPHDPKRKRGNEAGVSDFLVEATPGDYSRLLRTVIAWVEVA